MRPPSIVTFERFYLGSYAISLLNTLAFWPAMEAAMRVNPSVARMPPGFAPGVLVIGLVVSTAITLMLWYFVARSGSVVAKWIVTIFFAFGALSLVYGLAMGTRALNVQGIVGIVSTLLNAAAVWMLFRPDARLWFGEGDAVEPVMADREMLP